MKVRCFNYKNSSHLAKDCPKPPWISVYVSQGNKIFQGCFMVEINANKSKVFNLLKLKRKVNNELLCLSLGFNND
jgi:hypothetical protein